MSALWKTLAILAGGVFAGILVGTIGGRSLFIVPGAVIALVMAGLVLTKPYIGVMITIAALPLESLYTDVGFGASLLSLIGLFTLGAYLVVNRFAIKSHVGLAWVYRFAILFILWMFITNPVLSVNGERNWIFTYFQLLVLAWLSAQEFADLRRQRYLMIVFILVTAGTAIASTSQAQLTDTIYRSTRATGLTENANIFAMYLNIAICFTLYFILSPRFSQRMRVAMTGVLAILILGIALSISRSGAIALGAVLISAVVLYPRLTAAQLASNRVRNFIALVLVAGGIVLAALILIPPQYWQILQEARTLIEQGSEADRGTYVIRLELWTEAIQHWRTSPIWGIGVGQFRELSGHVAHNMYFQVLAEQGVIGVVILFGWLGAIIWNLLRGVLHRDDPDRVAMASSWLLALIAILVMGLTGSWELYSKSLWSLMGISTAFMIVQSKAALPRTAQASPQPQFAPGRS